MEAYVGGLPTGSVASSPTQNKIMNKKQANMEKMVALVLIAYAIGLLTGEKLRDAIYKGSRKWKLYSGLFVLLKPKIRISMQDLA